MNLKVAFSPCPNDTFAFEAMVNSRIEHPFKLDLRLDDIKHLNALAQGKNFDVVKVSFHALAFMLDDYQILDSGSALGFGVGPLLISKEKITEVHSDLRVAIPGEYTTANFLLKYAFPELHEKQVMLFNEIESAVLNKEVDLGLIIHESRFTYKEKGLIKIADLGEIWEKNTGFPIPLGAIAIKRSLPEEIKRQFQRSLHQSISFARLNPTISKPYITLHAQEMDPQVQQKHIELYVNDYTLALENKGKMAIIHFFKQLITKDLPLDLFITA